jgi:hypothetical protein
MAKVQSRRTISFNRKLYMAILKAATASDKAASHWVADLVLAELQRIGTPFTGKIWFAAEVVAAPKPPKRLKRSRPKSVRTLVDEFMAGVLP